MCVYPRLVRFGLVLSVGFCVGFIRIYRVFLWLLSENSCVYEWYFMLYCVAFFLPGCAMFLLENWFLYLCGLVNLMDLFVLFFLISLALFICLHT